MTMMPSLSPMIMVRLQLLSWLLLLSCRSATAVGMSDPLRVVDILNHKQQQPFVQQHDTPDVQELFLEQRLTHFAQSPGTFQQRYFYSNRHVREGPQYAFLCVGGEGPSLTPHVLTDSVHCTGDMLELADRLDVSIHLFALEHRYYGKSFPRFYNAKNESVSPVTNEHLVYLSSRQALGDLAHFVSQMMEQGPSTPLPPTTKWIAFGGSYPGMLAAYSRLKYPHLIHAAVSNSAPIHIQLDMPQYNDRISVDLQYDKVGGSPECLRIFEEGHAQLIAMLDTDRDTVVDAFQLCNASALDYRPNVQAFLGDGVVHVPAQSNDPSCNDTQFCNIERMCSFATNHAPAPSWQILRDMVHAMRQDDGDCVDLDWNSTLKYLADPDLVPTSGLRSWFWQTCTEFGFYQTCLSNSNCPYARGYHPLSQDLQICSYAFGIDDVPSNVQQTQEYYGSKLTGASRIVSVNGNVDPWATLGLAPLLLPVLLVEGASHHFWTHPPKDTDTLEVQQARQFIYRTVTQWLELAGDKVTA